MTPRALGLTLIELLVVLAVMAVLVALAVPDFRSVWVRRTVLVAAEALMGDLRFARTEALKRARQVVVCQSSDGLRCGRDREAWGDGWLLFVDNNDNGSVDTANADGAADVVLRVQPRAFGQLRITSNGDNGHAVAYQAMGSARGAAQRFTFEPAGSVPDRSLRVVCVSLQGRPRLAPAGVELCS